MQTQPLTGITVLDFGQVYNGPYCGFLLAQAGARVIKVESLIGETLRARWCIMATGCLSSANRPEFPGLETFTGDTWHTGDWPHDGVDFSGLNVGLIGTGSSGVQAAPVIAAEAAHLHVFQRTPNWSVPARNAPLSAAEQQRIKDNYNAYRAQQRALPIACHHPPRKQNATDATLQEQQTVR